VSFHTELDALIHRYTRQEYLGTYDYTLACYVLQCIVAVDSVVRSVKRKSGAVPVLKHEPVAPPDTTGDTP
jgi:hypothetical protein